jgi:filamentous hemagglutinin family protein
MRALATIAPIWLAAQPAAGQVTLDGSLGPAGAVPLVSAEYAITDDLGRYAGDNLFHSFSSFDVGTGETATFSASLDTPERVIARVTGGSRSDIHGRLRSTIPGADLFLLNASGVSLGDGAELDVDGSFYTGSANLLRFESGPDLVVSDATPDPLLSTAAPAFFGFTSGSPALIEVARTNALEVPAGETLSIVGGDVFVTGDPSGVVAPILIDSPGSKLEIASAAGPVDIPVALGDLDMDGVEPGTLGTVDVFGATLLMSGVGATPSGGVTIRAGRFVLEGKSQIVARNNASAAPAAGPIDIAVTGDGVDGTPDLLLVGSQVQIQSWSAGNAPAGDVLLSGDEVEVRGGAQLVLFNGGSPSHTGDGPDLAIDARTIAFDGGNLSLLSLSSGEGSSAKLTASESISIGGGAQIVSELLPGSTGDGGTIDLDPETVTISGGAQVSTLNGGSGIGTGLSIEAETLVVTDGAGVLSRATGSGPGGPVDIEVTSLSVTDAGRITSGSVTGDPGGPIGIGAESVLVSNAAGRPEGTFISANNGAPIGIDAELVELVDGGQLVTTTFTGAPAGALSIANADVVRASGVDAQDRPAGLFTRTRESAGSTGTGGPLSIDTRILEVDNGGELSSSTFGPADAGPIEIGASERVTVQGGPNGFSLIAAAAQPGSSGDGGPLSIETDVLELRDGGQVTTSTFSVGDAGVIDARARVVDVSGVDPLGGNPSGFFSGSNTAGVIGGGDGGEVGIHATQSVQMWNQAVVFAEATGSGLAGDVLIDGGDLFQMDDASVSTKVISSAGGNVKVTADTLVYLNESTISTDVQSGAGGGGDVTIDPVHTVLNHSSITTTGVEGPGGNIHIVTDYYFQSGDSFLDARSQLGIDGTIDVTAPDTDLTAGLLRLPATYLDASALLERGCAARTERAGSFAVSTGAFPAAPDSALTPLDAGYCPLLEETP